jgi:O-methyltransferase involved in polyketide biosynthesis
VDDAPIAVSTVQAMPGDLTALFRRVSRSHRGTIVNTGCGHDTTFERVDNGDMRWFDLDLPEVIEFRGAYFTETTRRRFLAKSDLDPGWLDDISTDDPVLLIMAGVLYYFTEEEIRRLFAHLADRLAHVEIVFDYCSETGMKIANKRLLAGSRMEEPAQFRWCTNNIMEMETWHPDIRVTRNMPMFKEHRKRMPLRDRIGPMVSDAMNIMSLAHLEISRRTATK